ncbi:hypothetical protein GPK96_19295 [Blautia sp. MCC289]|nr:hypothetical protein [Blautia sp. MCC289]
MSFFSIKDFIVSGKKSLENKNYWSALSVALMLPSMCSRLTYRNNFEKYKNFKWNNKNDHSKGKIYTDWKDRECYIDWCNEYINDAWTKTCLGEKYAEILYNLRCDIVHAGCANIYADGKGLYLSIGDNSNTTKFTKYRILDVSSLCNVIFDCSDKWSTNFGASEFKYTRVFDSQVRDDRLLYAKLCDEEYADYLKEQFDRENSVINKKQ